MATTATGTPTAGAGYAPAAAHATDQGGPGELSDPALISSWSLARVKVALNPADPDAVKAYAALRDEYRRRTYDSVQ
jgi:hypothetical protein